MTDLAEAKRSARAAGAAARSQAHAAAAADVAKRLAAVALAAADLDHAHAASGYLPIRTEIDPRPLMSALHARGLTVCVPVIEAPGLPLRFRAWAPDAALVRGPFDVAVPADGAWVVPDLLFVPLMGFDDEGYRLGYGGGFYDRTLALLRSHGQVRAIGLAYAAQRLERVPRDASDARLDAIATETGLIVPE